jgi:hypothetical protein
MLYLKKYILVIQILVLNFTAYCQTEVIDVSIVEDYGDIQPKFNLCILPFGISKNAALENYSLDMRAFGFYEPVRDKFGFSYAMGQGLFNDYGAFIFGGEEGYHLRSDFDFSVYGVFKKQEGVRITKVKINRNYFKDQYAYGETEAKWSAINAINIGYSSIQEDIDLLDITTYPFFDLNPGNSYDLNIELKGFSIGYYRRAYRHIVVEEIENKKKHTGIGGRIFYADLLAYPFQNFGDRLLGTNLTDSVKALGDVSPLGLRVGLKLFSAGHRFSHREVASAEIGYWPYHGIRMRISFGICAINRHEKKYRSK